MNDLDLLREQIAQRADHARPFPMGEGGVSTRWRRRRSLEIHGAKSGFAIQTSYCRQIKPARLWSSSQAPFEKGCSAMPTITTKDGVEIFYKDWGSGQPIVFSHGWPLSADDWDVQMLFFLARGYRAFAAAFGLQRGARHDPGGQGAVSLQRRSSTPSSTDGRTSKAGRSGPTTRCSCGSCAT